MQVLLQVFLPFSPKVVGNGLSKNAELNVIFIFYNNHLSIYLFTGFFWKDFLTFPVTFDALQHVSKPV